MEEKINKSDPNKESNKPTDTTNEQSSDNEAKEEKEFDTFAIQADKDKDSNSTTIERIK